MPWIGLQTVIVVFPDHAHFLLVLFYYEKCFMLSLSDNDETLKGGGGAGIPYTFKYFEKYPIFLKRN